MRGWHQGRSYNKVIGDEKNFDYKSNLINAVEDFWWGADYYVETLPNFGKDGSWMIWDKRIDESKDKMFGSGFEMLWSKNKHQRRLIRQMWAGFMGDAEASKRVHPTQKPTKLAVAILNEYGKVGDLVTDLFGGSGSTLIACEQTGRKCRMMEIDPKYCDVILNRWVAQTGGEPIREDGMAWSELNGKLE
jgi:DNA modification methylase